MTPRRILITGGVGFVGTNLARYFLALGHAVLCVDDFSRAGVDLNAARVIMWGGRVVRSSIEAFAADGGEPVDLVLNCAAQSSATKGMVQPLVDVQANVVSCAAALEVAKRHQAPFIQWSTNKVYPAEVVNQHGSQEDTTRFRHDWSPAVADAYGSGSRSVYGATKLAAEALIDEWAHGFGLDVIINRFSCLAGAFQFGTTDQGWFAHWVLSHVFGQPLTYVGWQGKQVRDVLAAEDMCRLIECQAEMLWASPSPGRVAMYNVGGGSRWTISLQEATALCVDLVGRSVPIVLESEPRWADHRVYVSDLEPVATAFGWLPDVSPTVCAVGILDWVRREREALAALYGVA